MPCVIFLDQVLMSLGFHTDEFVQFFFFGGVSSLKVKSQKFPGR